MIEAEWWDYDSAEELAEAIAGDAQFVIESALDARGDAIVAFPGGNTPLAALDLLKKAKLKWKDVTIVPTDDRLVPVQDKLSNVRMLAERFLPLGARVLPLTGGDLPVAEAGKAADARLQAVHWPLDFVWLGMGADGVVHPGQVPPDRDERRDLLSARVDARPEGGGETAGGCLLGGHHPLRLRATRARGSEGTDL
jgi:6-phosphogluconolactonase